MGSKLCLKCASWEAQIEIEIPASDWEKKYSWYVNYLHSSNIYILKCHSSLKEYSPYVNQLHSSYEKSLIFLFSFIYLNKRYTNIIYALSGNCSYINTSFTSSNVLDIKEWKNSTCWLILVVIVKLWFSVLLKLRLHIITHPSITNDGGPPNLLKSLKYTVEMGLTPQNMPQTSISLIITH